MEKYGANGVWTEKVCINYARMYRDCAEGTKTGRDHTDFAKGTRTKKIFQKGTEV